MKRIRDLTAYHQMSTIILLLIPLILLFILSFLIGRYPISPSEVLTIITSKILPININSTPAINTVIFDIRLPRILAAMLVGAALSVAGAALQGLFRNPLVAPDKLGVTAGAGFGAALAILLYAGAFLIQISAFIWGLIAVTITYLLSKTFKGTSMLTLVLTGIAVEAFFAAMIALSKYMADPYSQLPTIVFWLLGSLSSINNQDLLMMGPPIIIGILILLMVRWRINVLSMGEEEAKTMGIETGKLQAIIIISSTIITASAVSLCGIIGWIGLVIPHVARMIVGPDHKVLLPASIILGAFFLLLIDDISRTLTTIEIPLGILTAIIGAPFFLYLLAKSKEVWT